MSYTLIPLFMVEALMSGFGLKYDESGEQALNDILDSWQVRTCLSCGSKSQPCCGH